MNRLTPPALALLLLTPAIAAHATSVTRARGHGFTAVWDMNQPCPDPQEGGQLLGARLTFAETTDPAGTPTAFLELHHANDCSPDPLPLPFDATGTSDGVAQQFSIDRELSFATYQADIPISVEGTDCPAIARVDVRLDAVAPVRRERNLFRANEDGMFLLQFEGRAYRPSAPSGSIRLLDPLGCVDDRVPSEFAVFPQVYDADGAASTTIFSTRLLTVTRAP